ncbi:MAG: CaiB/BaiF CoA-transferase family protein [Pyrinomonadaceae bacterium]
MDQPQTTEPPLRGLKVLEMGQLIAGPFAAAILASFGAEVIKIELPGTGDSLRSWRKVYKGTSLWWHSIARNKKSITLDLTQPDGQAIARRLAAKVDIVLENFKPGTMEKWGLGYDDLTAVNPGLIMVRVSGWGQTGPYANRPGFANVAEGVGGIRYTSGYPDRPPVRTGTSLGDSLAAIHAALGALIAVYHRDGKGSGGTGQGQMVDVAIYESVFNMMESLLPEYDKLGYVRERRGAQLEGIVPTSSYLCRDGKYLTIGGNGESIFRRLMTAIGRPEMAADPRFEGNPGRVAHETEINQALDEWTAQHDFDEAYATLLDVSVPCGPIYSIADIAADPHYQAREMFETADLGDGDSVKVPAIVPKLSKTPGRTEWHGPALGAHNAEIFGDLLQMNESELSRLRADRVI